MPKVNSYMNSEPNLRLSNDIVTSKSSVVELFEYCGAKAFLCLDLSTWGKLGSKTIRRILWKSTDGHFMGIYVTNPVALPKQHSTKTSTLQNTLTKGWLETEPLIVPRRNNQGHVDICRISLPIFRLSNGEGCNLHFWLDGETPSRSPHSHPWKSRSFIKFGHITSYGKELGEKTTKSFTHRAGDLYHMGLDFVHTILSVGDGALSVFAFEAPVNNLTWGVLNKDGCIEKEDNTSFKEDYQYLNSEPQKSHLLGKAFSKMYHIWKH